MRRDPFLALVLVAFILTCAGFGARAPVDPGSIELALALQQQDVRLHHPHPPGFVLYVWLAQFVQVWVHDAVTALRAVAIAALVAAAVLVYRLAALVFDRPTARWATLLFCSSPLVLFHGMTTSTFGAEAFAAALVAFLCLRAPTRAAAAVRPGAPADPAPDLRFAAYLAGLVPGLRQTMVLFALPVLALTVRRAHPSRRQAWAATFAWLLGTLSWLVPQVERCGGLGAYASANLALLQHVVAASPLQAGAAELGAHLHRMATALLCGLGVLRVIASLGWAAIGSRGGRDAGKWSGTMLAGAGPVSLDRALLFAWLLPLALVGLIVHFPTGGGVLAAWPVACIGLARLLPLPVATSLPRPAPSPRRAKRLAFVAVTCVALLLDVGTFFTVPAGRRSGSAGTRLAPAEGPSDTVPGAARPGGSSAPDFGPSIVDRLTQAVFAGVDFFFDRTRHAEFAPALEALATTGFPAEAVLLLGGPAARAASYLRPDLTVLHADPVRPAPFLVYSGRRARRPEDPYIVPDSVSWILIEGNRGQLQGAAGELLGGPVGLRFGAGLTAIPVGGQAIDAWFVPDASGGTPIRLHLIRDAQPRHTVPERATADPPPARSRCPRAGEGDQLSAAEVVIVVGVPRIWNGGGSNDGEEDTPRHGRSRAGCGRVPRFGSRDSGRHALLGRTDQHAGCGAVR